LPGRYSRKTVVSSTRLPPAPNALKHTNKPKVVQLGEAPAIIVNIAETRSEKLKAKRRPMISAENPQKIAPTSMPTNTAIVKPVAKLGWNSMPAGPAVMDWIKRISESTAYPKPFRQKSFQWWPVNPISSIV
jgi:hypothetical protein